MLLKTDQPPEYCRLGQKFFERPVLPAGMAGIGPAAEPVGGVGRRVCRRVCRKTRHLSRQAMVMAL